MNTELLINGQFEKGTSDPEDVINPTNGELISSIPQASEDQIDKAVQSSKKAFASLINLSLSSFALTTSLKASLTSSGGSTI